MLKYLLWISVTTLLTGVKLLNIWVCIYKVVKLFKFDINPTKRAFYAACNSIFMHGSGVDEIALLSLQEI